MTSFKKILKAILIITLSIPICIILLLFVIGLFLPVEEKLHNHGDNTTKITVAEPSDTTKLARAKTELQNALAELQAINLGIVEQIALQDTAAVRSLHSGANIVWNTCMEISVVMGTLRLQRVPSPSNRKPALRLIRQTSSPWIKYVHRNRESVVDWRYAKQRS